MCGVFCQKLVTLWFSTNNTPNKGPVSLEGDTGVPPTLAARIPSITTPPPPPAAIAGGGEGRLRRPDGRNSHLPLPLQDSNIHGSDESIVVVLRLVLTGLVLGAPPALIHCCKAALALPLRERRPELRRLVDLPQHYLPVHVLALGLRWWRAALGSHGAAGNGQPSAHAVAAGGATVRGMVVAI